MPMVFDPEKVESVGFEDIQDDEQREELKAFVENMAKGNPFFRKSDDYPNSEAHNVWFSRCYNCDQVAIWVYNRMIYPLRGEAPPANPDMPEDIRRDYDEASAILDISPRGAAALIRFAIDRLCIEIGDPKKSINDNIAAFVKDGLGQPVQRALDAVRVIGNHAVHPGQIDLQDDRATAESLFRLLNLIVERMISQEKQVNEVYDALPENLRTAIEKRDGKDGS